MVLSERYPMPEGAVVWSPSISEVDRVGLALANVEAQLGPLLAVEGDRLGDDVERAAHYASLAYALTTSIFIRMRCEGYDGSILGEFVDEIQETMIAVANKSDRVGWQVPERTLRVDRAAARRIVEAALGPRDFDQREHLGDDDFIAMAEFPEATTTAAAGEATTTAAGEATTTTTAGETPTGETTTPGRDDDDDDDAKNDDEGRKEAADDGGFVVDGASSGGGLARTPPPNPNPPPAKKKRPSQEPVPKGDSERPASSSSKQQQHQQQKKRKHTPHGTGGQKKSKKPPPGAS
eukprot:CAMPEP_0118910336 /NCGR_PEP_ID=MMETSP1166-20130328/12518_1 /TAXON_ID=1104430 /ORGANISM="Chrysoreinhardia sp, Strain CCMP3193" /LENGTH=292 /DNA_ID=CAMNT_0006849797 /DNA_START=20 /DNA_END=898 /DNA_ORIENTATION=+